jgi:hypothetical protein
MVEVRFSRRHPEYRETVLGPFDWVKVTYAKEMTAAEDINSNGVTIAEYIDGEGWYLDDEQRWIDYCIYTKEQA